MSSEPFRTDDPVFDPHELAIEAYVFLYPLVIMELTRRQMTRPARYGAHGHGLMGSFSHGRAYPGAEDRVVVRPNFDTLYSVAWLDVGDEPALVRLPPTPGRYAVLPMMDMWSDVFAAPGTRSTGDQGGLFAVVDPRWRGELPDGAVRIEAPTPTVWIIGRIQTNGPDDYAAVHAIQDGFETRPLSRWDDPSAPSVADGVATATDTEIDLATPPLRQVNGLGAEEFFALAAELLVRQPVHLTDWSMVARMAHIGIEPGLPFDPTALDPAVRAAMGSVPRDARHTMLARGMGSVPVIDGWQLPVDTMGVYGNYYAKRAAIAMVGLGALPAEEAVYPSLQTDTDHVPLDGANDYVLHFEAGQLPPVGAFWSVTMYDHEGFQAANPINRFALGDRDPLTYNADGSLDIYLQHEAPGGDLNHNWLPAPVGPLGVTLRLYLPLAGPGGGQWTPPAVQRVS